MIPSFLSKIRFHYEFLWTGEWEFVLAINNYGAHFSFYKLRTRVSWKQPSGGF